MPWIIGSTAYNTVNGVAGVYDAENGGEIGTESGRVVRLIRMIRLVRMVKLYKYASILRKIKKTKEQNQLSESRVGAAMSDLTNRK